MTKRILLALAVSVGMSAAAATGPDLFECSGHDLTVYYTTTSFTGQPTFGLSRSGQQAMSRLGKEISSQRTLVGNLVSIQTQSVPDLKTVSATLVVPTIHMPDHQPEVEFETVLITTESRTSIAGPQIVQGVVNPSQYEKVTCKAKIVIF